MKKLFAVLLSLVLLVAVASVAGATSTNSMTVEYEGFGYAEADFAQDVRWQDAQVTVTDAEGNTYETRIVKMDDDDLTFYVEDIVEDQVYTCTISGIQGESALTAEFYAASAKSTMIKEVEYDAEDRELDIEFTLNVQYQDSVVTVTDAAGNEYVATILDRDHDSIETRVDGLVLGETYVVSVSGVLADGSETAETYVREFIAQDF